MEHCVNELMVQFIGFTGIEQSIVDIGTAIIEGWEKETKLRRSNDLVGRAVKLIVTGEITQLCFFRLDRTDCAQEIGEYLIRITGAHNIRILPGHIIAVAGHEQKIAALSHIQRLDDILIKPLTGMVIFQFGSFQFHQEFVFRAFCDLFGGEHDIEQIFSKGSGQYFLEQIEIFFSFFLQHQAKRLVQISNDLSIAVDKAAVESTDGVLIRLPTTTQFIDFFFIHWNCQTFLFCFIQKHDDVFHCSSHYARQYHIRQITSYLACSGANT